MVAGKTDQRGSDGAMPVRAQRPRTRAMAEGVGRGEPLDTVMCWLDFTAQLHRHQAHYGCSKIRVKDMTPQGPCAMGKFPAF